MTNFTQANQICKVICLQVVVIMAGYITKFTKWLDVVNVQRTAIGLLCFATILALVAVTLARGTPLLLPVGSIVLAVCAAFPIRSIGSRSVLCLPNSFACMAAKEVFLVLVMTLTRVGAGLVQTAALIAGALRNATLPDWRIFSYAILRLPYPTTCTAAKTSRFTCSCLKRFSAYIAGYSHALAHICMTTGAITKVLWSGAICGVLIERFTALVARKRNHNKTSLTRGSDKWRGWLVSAASRSERFMTPFLSLYYYTTFGIKTPQTALMIDSNPQVRKAEYCDRADGSKARTAQAQRLSPKSYNLLAMETAL
jgi:hypothetical protein